MGVAGPKCLGVVLVVAFVLGLGGWGEGCWEQEKLALLQLKPLFNVQRKPFDDIDHFVNHSALYDWVLENSDCCQWERVECDATTKRVMGLSLTNTFMVEKYSDPYSPDIPSGWYLNASVFLPFEELKSLNLSWNGIAGCVDNEGFEKLILKLKKLEVLDLSFNCFNDSSILSFSVEISSLKSLNLSRNQLRGISTKLSELSSLKYLDLSYNYINGSIDNNELKNLISLKELHLRGPAFETLDSLPRLIDLEVFTLTFWISNNSDTSILSYLGPFSKCLKHFYYSDNGYSEGSIDINEARGLENLKGAATNNSVLHLLQQSLSLFPSLRTLHFDSDAVYVDIQELRNLTNLEELYLDYINLGWYYDNSSLLTNLLGIVGELTALRVLSLETRDSYDRMPPVQGVLQLKNLESLKVQGIPLQNNFLENIGAMTSLQILSLTFSGLNGTLSTKGQDDICQLTRLQELDLSNNELRGVLPDCISNLKFLRHLNLSSNQFYGNLSAISPLQSLTYIDLSNNQFQIPSSLRPFFNNSKLKLFYGNNNSIMNVETELHSLAPRFQLNHINLSCCGDVGPLPKFLYYQHKLQSVDLSNINLTGKFPIWLLENNTELKTLFLINNSLWGQFRLPFHSPMKLLELDVSSNFIDGFIPVEIGISLPGLTILNISKNHLDGSIPTSIGDMKSLETLDLSNNRLYGVIPENLATCSSLRYLSLSNNRLQGQIFSANFNLINLAELYLANNNFTGSIPNSLSKSSSLSVIDISYNHLSGRIPRTMGNMSELFIILLPNNHIEGPIPREFCQLGIKVLDLTMNNISGTLHSCLCQVGIGVLDLTMNNISGTLPSCFFSFWIEHVHLSKNRLRGPIPNKICKSTRLVTLDLSDNLLTGNIPNCIGNLSELSYLVLKHNNLEGEIPNLFCQLKKLSLIDLSHNNLSGRIPNCLNLKPYEEVTNHSSYSPLFETKESIELTIKNVSYLYKGRILTYFSGIDLSSNKLVGKIPYEMGNFHRIQTLNLSHNSLTGLIPPSLSNLEVIESLDISYNNLSGNIPFQFIELGFLAYFNVSYNNLSGKPPPRIRQFATYFDANSYWGNPFLCGEPLPKNCSTIPNQPAEDREDDEKGGLIDIESFCVTFIVSYIIVLLSIVAIMYINPYWRRAWFYLVERSITSCFYFVIDNLPYTIPL